jgi:hypothetical protein
MPAGGADSDSDGDNLVDDGCAVVAGTSNPAAPVASTD